MNKLRKTSNPPTSTTNLVERRPLLSTSSTTALSKHSNLVPIPVEIQPLTASEQYWATRALKAEALLSAQESHHREVRSLGFSQDVKRSRELATLAQQHKEKHASMEKLVMLLTATVALLVLLVIYLATHYTHHSLLLQQQQQQRHWLAGLPSHFTIPILSPFTSVVEKETSVIGTRSITAMSLVAGLIAYLVFRHWLSSRGVVAGSR